MITLVVNINEAKKKFIFSNCEKNLNNLLLFEIEESYSDFSIPILMSNNSYNRLYDLIQKKNQKFHNWGGIKQLFLNYFYNIDLSDDLDCQIYLDQCKIYEDENKTFDEYNGDENRIGVIVRQWDAFDFSSTCISDLINTNYVSLNIYLIDDASSDNSYIRLAFDHPSIKLIRFINRQEYTRCLNIGAEIAILHGCKFIFFTNSDTKQFNSLNSSNFFENMIFEFRNDSQVGLVSPKVMDWDGSEQTTRTSKKLGYVFDIATEAYMISAEVWKKVHGFDNILIRYCEDIMIIQKIKSFGFKVKSNQLSFFRHFGMGSSVKQVFIPTFYRIRNGIMILKENHSIFKVSFFFYLKKWLKPHFILIKKEVKLKLYFRAISRIIYLLVATLFGLFSKYKKSTSWRTSKIVLTNKSIRILKLDYYYEKRFMKE